MAAHDKIIRLEKISGEDLGGEKNDVDLKFIQSAPAIVGQEDDLLKFYSEKVIQHADLLEEEKHLEHLAPVSSGPVVPENWPQIPQLFEQHSWNFSTAVSPSINKAVGHLELLQTVVEEWLEAEAIRANSKTIKRSLKSSKSQQRKQLHFTDGASPDSKQLSIQGVGAIGDASVQESVPKSEDGVSNFPYLGAEEVVEETVTLLAKLETDRQETLAKLASERDRVKTLGEKIDKLAEQRLLDLPVAVQKEHEACASTISSLNWSVSYKRKNQLQLETRVAVALALNKKLKEDVAFVHSHIPLVKEKLELEQEAMRRIETAQDEDSIEKLSRLSYKEIWSQKTNVELQITEEHHQAVQEKSAEVHMQAEKERAAMKKDLDGVRTDLKNINEELEESKKQYLTYCGSTEYCEKKLKTDKEELKVLMVKEENAKTKEAFQAVKAKDLKEKIVAAEYEHGRLSKFIANLTREKNEKYQAGRKLQAKLKMEIVGKTEIHRQWSRKNKEMKMDIEDMQDKIKRWESPEFSDKQKEKDEKNIIRMMKEKDRSEKLLEAAEDELAQIQIINATLKDQMRSEEEKCCSSEEQLRSTTEALKRQVKDEKHNRAVLVARINSDTNESEKFEVEVQEKVGKATKTLDEVQIALKNIKSKVEKFRKELEDRQKMVKDCEEEIKTLKEGMEEVNSSTAAEILAVAPLHEELLNLIHHKEKEVKVLQVVMNSLNKRLEHIEKKSAMMKSKMEDMAASSGMMEKSFKNTSKQIDNLMEMQEELQVQMEINRKLDDETIAAIDDVTARINHRAKNHRELMKERRAVLSNQEKELRELLEVNDQLAKQYRAMQSEYIKLKNQMLTMYDDKVRNENSIRDVRQLQSLQKRMQAALLEYFKYRGLYNEGELSRLENNSDYNGMCAAKLKKNMNICLNKIAHFLNNQLHPASIHKMAMEKVASDEAAAKAHQQSLANSAHQQQPIAG